MYSTFKVLSSKNTISFKTALCLKPQRLMWLTAGEAKIIAQRAMF